MDSRMLLVTALFLLGVYVVSMVQSHTLEDMYKLTQHFANASEYKSMRPIFNQSQPIQVVINQALTSVDIIDESRGVLETKGYIFLSWKDELLQWEPSAYGGIATTDFQIGNHWAPDIYLENKKVAREDLAISFINHDGQIFMFITIMIQTRCDMDTSLFPFDSHTCTFNFFSGKHHSGQLFLLTPSSYISLFEFEENHEWDIVKNNSAIVIVSDTDSLVTNMVYRTNIVLKRRPAFIVLHSLLPCFLLMVLNLFTSKVPLNSGERLSYSVTISLAFVFLMNTITGELPVDSINISLTSIMFVFINATNTITVLMSVLFVKMAAIDAKTVAIPHVLQKIVQWQLKKGNRVSYSTKNVDIKRPKENIPTAWNSTCNIPELETVETNNRPDDIEKEESAEMKSITDISWTDVARVVDDLYFKCLLAVIMILLFAIAVFLWTKRAF